MPDTTRIRILIADDQQDIIDALRLLLIDEGYEVTPARSPAEALERLEATDFDLAILDLNLGPLSGLDILDAWKRKFRDLDIVLTNARDPFGGRRLLPLGDLREPISALRRAGMVVITHVDRVNASELSRFVESIYDEA